MVVDGSELSQGRIQIGENFVRIVILVCALEEEAAEAAHARNGHDRGGNAAQLASGMLG